MTTRNGLTLIEIMIALTMTLIVLGAMIPASLSVKHGTGGSYGSSMFQTPSRRVFFVITAYELRGKPLTAYRRRRRKGER